MNDTEALKAELKKLSSAAIQAKMDLHDLSEDLPNGWERIPQVAERALNAYRILEQKRLELKAATTG